MTSADRQEFIRETIRAVYNQEPEEAKVPPYEWGIINAWMQEGLPLATVLQAVGQMEKHPTIRYVRQAVHDEEFRRLRELSG